MDPTKEFETAKIALEEVLQAVRVGDPEDIEKYLSTIALEYIPAVEQIHLLDIILHYIYQFGDGQLVDFIFSYFDKANDATTVIPTLSLYLMRSNLQDHLLAFIGANITSSFTETIYGINQAPISPLTYEGCLNAEKVFGVPDAQILLQIDTYLFTDPKDLNKYIYQYVKDRIGDVEAPRPKPDWVINVSGEEGEIPIQDSLQIPDFPNVSLMSPGTYADVTVKELVETGFKQPLSDDNFTYKTIATQYGMFTLEQKIFRVNDYNQNVLSKKLVQGGEIKKIEVDTNNDEVLFLLFGPNNTNYDQEIKPDPSGEPCERFGGCRMLICGCSEAENNADDGDIYEYDDFGVPEIDWFKGKCQQCDLKINYRHYALRKPLPLGGWVGCFCSIECVSKSVKPDDLITPPLIARLDEALNQLGIQDRTYSDAAQTISI